MKVLTVKLPGSMAASVAKAAQKRGTTLSEVVRAALEAYLRSGQRRNKGSCLELAGDLAGCVAGPGDLATDKRQMRGYGR